MLVVQMLLPSLPDWVNARVPQAPVLEWLIHINGVALEAMDPTRDRA